MSFHVQPGDDDTLAFTESRCDIIQRKSGQVCLFSFLDPSFILIFTFFSLYFFVLCPCLVASEERLPLNPAGIWASVKTPTNGARQAFTDSSVQSYIMFNEGQKKQKEMAVCTFKQNASVHLAAHM